jgi:hypothetical protein
VTRETDEVDRPHDTILDLEVRIRRRGAAAVAGRSGVLGRLIGLRGRSYPHRRQEPRLKFVGHQHDVLVCWQGGDEGAQLAHLVGQMF